MEKLRSLVADTRRAEANVKDRVASAHMRKMEQANMVKVEKNMIRKRITKIEKMSNVIISFSNFGSKCSL